jgi:NADH-quinone oxidoreductase subunit N
MNVGAFTAVSVLTGKGERFQSIDDFKGLGRKQPLTAALFSIFLLSLIGVPLTGGFFGKFYIFKAALDSHLVWLTILGLLNSAVAAYYYLRILVVMYMQEPGEATESAEPLSAGLRIALLLPALGNAVPGHLPHLGTGVRRQILGDCEVACNSVGQPIAIQQEFHVMVRSLFLRHSNTAPSGGNLI